METEEGPEEVVGTNTAEEMQIGWIDRETKATIMDRELETRIDKRTTKKSIKGQLADEKQKIRTRNVQGTYDEESREDLTDTISQEKYYVKRPLDGKLELTT